MTVSELMSLLEDCDPDATVRIMMQESWPFENAITGLASGAEINESDDDDDEDADDEDVEDDQVVYIVEGTQLGYGSKRAWEAAH